MKNKALRHFIKVIFVFVVGVSVAHAGAYDDFFKAIEQDDEAQVMQLLKKGFDPNTVNADGLPGLSLAIVASANKTLKALEQAPGIDVQLADKHGDTPLMHASMKGRLDVVSDLLAKGAQPNKEGWTALHYAAVGGHLEIIKKLLDNSAYIDAESPNGTTPLMMAARSGQTNAVNTLLELGADPTIVSQSGYNAAGYAMKANQKDLAHKLMIAARDFKNKYYRFNKTPAP